MKQKLAKFISKFLVAYFKVKYGNRVNFGKNIILNQRFKICGQGQVFISDNCNLWAHAEPNQFFLYDKNSVIKIGKNSRLNGLTCHCETKIEIGKNCLSGSCTIMDTDFHTFADPQHLLYQKTKTKPVKIGKNVWLGGQSSVLKGTEIGDYSVLGFRAVASKKYPPKVVLVGNPAQIVKK